MIGAVLIPGAKAPKLVTRDMLKTMKTGSVLVDVAIDQGGCFETSKATTHGDPTFVVDGVVHYCVANMPGAVAKTSTLALTNATLPYALQIANQGWKGAMQANEEIKRGANVINGKVTYKAVAEAFRSGLYIRRPIAELKTLIKSEICSLFGWQEGEKRLGVFWDTSLCPLLAFHP